MELWQGAVVSWGGGRRRLLFPYVRDRKQEISKGECEDESRPWGVVRLGCWMPGELELGVVLALDCTSHTLASASLIAAAYRGSARLLICRPRHLHLTPQRASPSDSCQDTSLCSFAACFCTSEVSPPEHL